MLGGETVARNGFLIIDQHPLHDFIDAKLAENGVNQGNVRHGRLPTSLPVQTIPNLLHVHDGRIIKIPTNQDE